MIIKILEFYFKGKIMLFYHYGLTTILDDLDLLCFLFVFGHPVNTFPISTKLLFPLL